MKIQNPLIKVILLLFFILNSFPNYSQENRLIQLRNKLESITIDAPGLNEKVDINVSNASLQSFLRTIANAHNLNLNISNDLNEYFISNNFNNTYVLDVLLFTCKEFELTIELTGNILSIKRYFAPTLPPEERIIPITYNPSSRKISIDLVQDELPKSFKRITDETNFNIAFAPGLENIRLSSYIKEMPFESAMEKIAFSNNLLVKKSEDGYFLFYSKNSEFINELKNRRKRLKQQQNRQINYYFKILHAEKQLIEVDFENVNLETIIYDIGYELNLNMFTSTPLVGETKISIKSNSINYETLIEKILENTKFTFRNQNDTYFFGLREDSSLRQISTVPLIHRSIEIMKNNESSTKNSLSNFNNGYNNSNGNITNNYNNRNRSNNSNGLQLNNKSNEGLISIIPEEILKDLDVKIDLELNSFIISGPNQSVEKFKNFIKYIDKPIPVITIEVMILEVSNSISLETGINFGIGEEPSKTQGTVFPSTNLTVGANDVNKIISGSSSNFLSTLNIGKVVPEFYLNIKAMESNGDINVRSTPKLSTLNGHRSNLAIGETTYYVVTNQNYYGSQIPTTSEITNYHPIDAQLSIDLKPLVAGDQQITMEINVVQSTFSGERIAEEAPPNINTREFNSIVRVGNEELIMLGGLEEKVNNDSGTGVPFISRVPILKWFFSSRKKQNSTKKLVILIKPTIIF